MEGNEDKNLDKLIEALKINDGKEDWDDIYPEDPQSVMETLVKKSKLAFEPLVKLLLNPSKFSCLYAIKILGEIADPRAIQPIIKAFFSESFLDTFEDDETLVPKIALQKIGPPAIEPILQTLEQKKKCNDVYSITLILETLARIRDERSIAVLIDALFHPDAFVQETAINMLMYYGDKRAVEPLQKILGDTKAREYAVEAIRKLVPTRQYRAIIAPYAIEQLESYGREIRLKLRDILFAYEYPPRFEGYNADELIALSQEIKINSSIESILENAADLAVFEAAITDDEYSELHRIILNITRRKWDIDRQKEEEIAIIEGYMPTKVVHTKMARSYKGLVRSTYGPNPKLEVLRARIWEWLKEQEFKITIKNEYQAWAMKGSKEKRKGCYVAVVIDHKRPRTWGLVQIYIWGEGWTQNEHEQFSTAFWQNNEKIVEELVTKKKLKIQVIEN